MPNETLHGVKELTQKLGQIAGSTAPKKLRTAIRSSTNGTVRKMKKAAPRGTKPHKTYRGRTVAPGFLSRSIVRRVRLRDNKVSVEIGVKSEAFYGVLFLDQGPHRVTKRRMGNRRTRTIAPYTIKVVRWFENTFRLDRPNIESDIIKFLRRTIDRIARK